MKILVTGGAGFVGSHILSRAELLDYEINFTKKHIVIHFIGTRSKAY
ncbi:MAG: NAD-dependent epimerase/dehydratase family protein [Methanosarcinales archaeon]